MEREPLLMGSEVVARMDKWGVDWPAFMMARVNSFVEFRGTVPSELHILERHGIYLTETRRSQLEKLFRDCVAE